MADERIPNGYKSHESDFRSHYRETYDDTDHKYDFYEPAYRHGFRYGAQDEHRERDYEALEKELRRAYEKKHGANTFGNVRRATRYGFRRGRSHLAERGEHAEEAGVKGPSGSSQTASGDPGSFVRQSEENE